MASAALGTFPLGLTASLNTTLTCSRRRSPAGGGAWRFAFQVCPWHVFSRSDVHAETYGRLKVAVNVPGAPARVIPPQLQL